MRDFPDFPVYVDSPLAVEATNVFNEHMTDCMDEDTLALVRQGINPIGFEGLTLSVSADDSKLINDEPTPKVILSASGMCDAGRIRHHLKHNLWRPESTVLFVGYQGQGTLGRQLVDGEKNVKIFGESIAVQAEVRTLSGISGHADQNGLLKWIGSFTGDIRHVFVIHGENSVAEGFAKRLHDDLGRSATAPYNGESWDLTTDTMLTEGNQQMVAHEPREARGDEEGRPEARSAEPRPQEARPKHTYPQDTRSQEPLRGQPAYRQQAEGKPYGELLAAALRMNELVERMYNGSTQNQSRITEALEDLLRKFGGR